MFLALFVKTLTRNRPPDLKVGLSQEMAEFFGVLRAALRASDIDQQLQPPQSRR